MVALYNRIIESRTSFGYSSSLTTTAFTDTLLLGQAVGDPHHFQSNRSAFIQRLQQKSPVSAGIDDLALLQTFVQSSACNRRFVVTERGYFGLAPKIVRDNDICCIIFGCRAPFILRESNREGYYKVVGDSYIIGKDLQELEPFGQTMDVFGSVGNLDWVEWGLKEQIIYLC